MLQRLNHRAGHYALLLVVSATLFLPRLGAPSLWDIDEGNNAEAAREMKEAGDWIVPTFNYLLRTDKPALLYWLQIAGYLLFGVGEFAARLPSALAATGAVVLTYELGRRMFGKGAGLIGGLVLAGSAMFCASAHFANPDALLNAVTILTFLIFWSSYSPLPTLCPKGRGANQGCPTHSPEGRGINQGHPILSPEERGEGGGRGWFVPAGISTGFAVLAKGPVGLVLPLGVTCLFLVWSRRWRILLDRRLFWGALAFCLIAIPWYAWVGAETKAEFLRGFFFTHNVGRFLSPMENHQGPFYYYAAALALGFAPWSPFLGLAGWQACKDLRIGDGWPEFLRIRLQRQAGSEATQSLRALGSHAEHGNQGDSGGEQPGSSPRSALRFLLCWIAVYFFFFSLSGTKLPNYILPVYPPLAILTGRFLDCWRRGAAAIPRWVLTLSLACLAFVGIATALALLVAGGSVPAAFLRGRQVPGLQQWAWLGAVPPVGALAAWWFASRRQRDRSIAGLACSAILFVGVLVAGGSVVVDGLKAPRPLVKALQADQTEKEIRVGCYQYFQPSLVFYCRREVSRMNTEQEALDFLRYPLPVYLFLPATVWEGLETRVSGPHRLLARHRDLYRGWEVVVVTNTRDH